MLKILSTTFDAAVHLDDRVDMVAAWLYKYLAPTVASSFALCMWFSPMLEVLNVRRRKRLNDLNPLPFCFMYGNCLGWTVYGYLSNDYFITSSNFPGAALGAFYMASVMHVCGYEMALLDNMLWKTAEGGGEEKLNEAVVLALQKKREGQFTTLTTFLWACPLLWGLLGTISFTYLEPELGNRGTYIALLIIGIVCGVFAMAYFAAPLSTAYSAIKEWDSSSLYPPMIVANIVNCSCWVIYGYFAINDPMVWGQNGAGLLLQVFNFLLVVVIPRTRAKALIEEESRLAKEKANFIHISTEEENMLVQKGDKNAQSSSTVNHISQMEIATTTTV